MSYYVAPRERASVLGRKGSRRIFSAVGGSLLALSAAAVETDRWQPLGPEGASITVLFADPEDADVVFLGTNGGSVYRSGDRGDSWSLVGQGLETSVIKSLARARSSSAQLYAVGFDRVFALDQTDRWKDLGAPPGGQGVSLKQIAAHPTLVDQVFVTGRQSGSALPSVFRSGDGSNEWELVRAGGGPTLAFSSDSAGTLYAGELDGLIRSSDLGETWSGTNLEDAVTGSIFEIAQIVPDPSNPNSIYAALGGIGVGVARSTDGGMTWGDATASLADDLVLSFYSAVGLHDSVEHGASVLFSQENSSPLYVSNDGGDTWTPSTTLSTQWPGFNPVVIATSADGETVYLADDRGFSTPLLRSADLEEWQEPDSLPLASSVRRVVGDPSTSGRLLAVRNARLIETLDGGDTWAEVRFGSDGEWLEAIEQSSSLPQVIYLLSRELHSGFVPRLRVHRSQDSGRSWQERSLFESRLQSLTVDPTNAQRVLVVREMYADDQFRLDLLESNDGGLSFEPRASLPCGGRVSLAVAPRSGALLLGCSFDSGLPVSPPIYDNELHTSQDGGATWKRVISRRTSINLGWRLLFDQRDNSYAALTEGFQDGALFQNLDGGTTWSEIPTEAFDSIRTMELAGDRLYVGTGRDGVHVRRGGNWTAVGHGLTSQRINDLLFDPVQTDTLYAATDGGGVSRLRSVGDTPCEDTPTTFCLLGRFEVEAQFSAEPGLRPPTTPSVLRPADARAFSPNTGTFWFFTPTNTDLAVKMVDGRSVNGHFWLYYGSLTDVYFQLTVRDTLTGATRSFENPRGQLASFGDSTAFADEGTTATGFRTASNAAGATGPLELNGYRIEASWKAPQGTQGTGEVALINGDSAALSFFSPRAVDLFVKILDARLINERHWLFAGSLTDVEFELTVTHIESGQSRTYSNPQGVLSSFSDVDLPAGPP